MTWIPDLTRYDGAASCLVRTSHNFPIPTFKFNIYG